MVKIFVGNLNPESKSSDLQKKFEVYGKVTECDILSNYGFVHMEKDSDAEAAIEGLNNATFDGVKINVEKSHGKRGRGGGPMRRRSEGRYRDYPDRYWDGPPRYMGGGPGPRMPRYGGTWDDGYGGPYPPPRSPRGGFDYPSNGFGRYADREPVRPPPRSGPRDPPPTPSYRSGGPDPVSHARDYPKSAPRSKYDSYDNYGDYDRYRDGPPAPAGRLDDYYDNYGNYSSGGNYDDYRSGGRPYDGSYEPGYHDYGSDGRQPSSSRPGFSMRP